MKHTSVNRFTPFSKSLIISIPSILCVLLMGGIGVEAVVETCGVTSGNGDCYCERNEATLVLLNCSGVHYTFAHTL